MRYDLRCAGCQGAFTGLKNPSFPYCSARCRDYWDEVCLLSEMIDQHEADDRRIVEDGHA